MRRLAISAISAMAALLFATAPAAAQIWGGPRFASFPAGRLATQPTIGQQLDQIRGTIRDGRRAGQLTRHEARALRRERGAVDALRDRFARDGITESEQAELDARVEMLRSDVATARGK